MQRPDGVYQRRACEVPRDHTGKSCSCHTFRITTNYWLQRRGTLEQRYGFNIVFTLDFSRGRQRRWREVSVNRQNHRLGLHEISSRSCDF